MARGRMEKYDHKMLAPMFEEFGRRDVKIAEIADIIGTTPAVLSRYQNRHPELRQAYRRGKGNIIKDLKSAALKTAIEGNPQMQKYMLNNLTDYSDDKQPLVDQSIKVQVINFGDANSGAEVSRRVDQTSNRSVA